MKSRALSDISVFYPDEIDAYKLQIEVLSRDLPGALDELSNYSCHSIPHIQEVMEQSDYLFRLLQNWLTKEIGFSEEELDLARIHLLLAAKFHDIGMAGTESMRQLILHVDKMYTSYAASRFVSPAMANAFNEQLSNLAEISEKECSRWDKMPELYGTLCRAILGADQNKINNNDLISKYHDLVKKAIRKYHGETSARWIVEHKDVLKMRYGNDLQWDLIALIAALHTGNFYHHVDDRNTRRDCQEYCEYLCSSIGMDSSIVINCQTFKRVQVLASILRLADQRRCGSRLLTLTGKEISVVKTYTGALKVEYVADGIKRHLHINQSNEIIVAERLNDFGRIIVNEGNNCWNLCHEMFFYPVDDIVSEQLLVFRRIPSYVKEINDSLLGNAQMFHHVLDIKYDERVGGKASDIISLSANEIIKLLDVNLDPNWKGAPDKLINGIKAKPSRLYIEINS